MSRGRSVGIGGSGWTEILAPYARATGEPLCWCSLDRAEAGGANNHNAARAAFWKGVADKAIFGDVNAYDFGPKHPDAVPAGSADLVLITRAFHNWVRQDHATNVVLHAIFAMLKSGGVGAQSFVSRRDALLDQGWGHAGRPSPSRSCFLRLARPTVSSRPRTQRRPPRIEANPLDVNGAAGIVTAIRACGVLGGRAAPRG